MDISEHNNDTEEFNEVLSRESAMRQLSNTQILIDVMATRLVAIRKLGLSDITLKEIRNLEGKLIKHFSQQLDAKQRVNPQGTHELNHYPSLATLLTVAGVGATPANGLNDQGRSVEGLMRLSDVQLQSIITEMGGTSEDGRKLISALALLGNFQENREMDTADLYWDSWSKDEDVFNPEGADNHDYNENLSNHHKPYIENGSFQHSNGGSRNDSESSGSLPPDTNALPRTRASTDPSNTEQAVEGQRQHNRQIPSTSSSCPTPQSPSRGSRSSLESSDSVLNSVKSATPQPPRISMIPPSTASNIASVYTPPVTPGTPHKAQHYLVQSNSAAFSSSSAKGTSRTRLSSSGQGTSLGWHAKLNPNSLMPPFNKLKPSKSSEWHIGNRILPSTSSSENISASNQSLTSISALPSKHFSKPTKKSKRPHDLFLYPEDVPDFIAISRTASRRSSTTVSPESTMLNNPSPLSPRTPMTPATPGNVEMWLKDRDVNAHVMNASHTPKSSKSTFKFFRSFFTKIKKKPKLRRNRSTEQILGEDDALHPSFSDVSRKRSGTLPSSNFSIAKPPPSPDVCPQCAVAKSPPPSAEANPISPSDLTPLSPPTNLIDTDKTLIPDSLDDKSSTLVRNTSSTSDEESEATSTLTEGADGLSAVNLFRQGSMMHSEEWDIPYSQLEFHEKIGRGRVGTVYRGNWHGDVAVRVIDVNHNDEEKLKAFKQEIMIYMKTRHENVELFMGSCMNPPHLAIVTGFCRGRSLYNFIRANKTQFIKINRIKIIAQHIVQGMGYLHSKGIIHKDLKSKNIFVDGKKVVITDFGLVGLHAVSCDKADTTPGVLKIPDGWLCYLAPEVIKALRFPESESDDVISTLPYTMKSDVYAFGTVWYELLSSTWPFNGYSAESIIWQVGSGKKQNLSQLQGGKDVKDILMQSWAYNPDHRPDFSDKGIMGILDKLQMQIGRSHSSHPRPPGANRRGSHERLFDGPPLRGKSETDIASTIRSLPRAELRLHQLWNLSNSVNHLLESST